MAEAALTAQPRAERGSRPAGRLRRAGRVPAVVYGLGAGTVEVVGDVDGRTCVLVDDMIDTAGTITAAANLLHDRGAIDVVVATTHGVLSGPAVDRLKNAPIGEVVVTNTLPIPDEKRWDALTVLSVAPIIAEALDAVFEDSSVSEIFAGDNV